MADKFSPLVEAHLHKTTELSLERIDAFAESDRLTQLQVLSVLRHRAGEASDPFELTVFGIGAGFLGLVIAPATLDLSNVNPAISAVVGLTLGVMGLIALLPVLVPHILRKASAERAAVWLHAYDAELVRRRAMRGAVGRKWRKKH